MDRHLPAPQQVHLSLVQMQKHRAGLNTSEETYPAAGAALPSPACRPPAPPPPGAQADAKPWKLFFHLQHLVPWQTPRAIMFIALKLSLALLHGFAAFGLQQSLLIFPVHYFG